MDNFSDFFDADDDALSLVIPEPKALGDIRPNPRPLKASDRVATSSPIELPAEENLFSSPYGEETVIKSVSFHDMPPECGTETGSAQASSELDHEAPKTVATAATSAKCYALMGASGGVGVTSLCIQLAYDIAKRTGKQHLFGGFNDPTVCLIDLDFETGCCAPYLDIQPSLSISDICGPANKIDALSLQALMSYHESGLAVLTTPNALGANSLANPETILALLDAASQLYEHVIIDLPRVWQPWIGAAISGTDYFAIVGELTIPSLHTTRTRIENIEKVLGEDQSCEVILNKVERRSFRNALRLKDAEKALRRSVSAAICVDLDTSREAINCGEPVACIRPEARLVKDIKALSQKWFPEPKKRSGLFKDRRKKRRVA